MKQLNIGDVTITSIIERDGPWRKPEEMFPAYTAEVGQPHLAALLQRARALPVRLVVEEQDQFRDMVLNAVRRARP